ncbi:hypothetical protein ACFMQL_20585 [Nonomuraea fastidiosa]|uniref:hypothetical protein n=1 Tax=Nonomuraea fastidiosa TaxID=46173 RepID=UPI00366A6C88
MQVIRPGRAERFALRLAVYEPNGDRLGSLPHHLGFEVGMPLNDTSSLKLTYPAAGVGAGLLAQPCEIAVEYAVDGGQWVEPDGGRFLRIKRGSDNMDLSRTMTFECPGWSWQLRKLIMYAGPVMADGKRPFSAVSAGAILRTLIDEAQARGTCPGLDTDFSTTRDSAGQPWDKTLTLELEPGVDLLTLLINLSEQGVLDWTMRGRTLRVFNEGTELGRDLAGGVAPVDLRLTRDIDEAPDSATLEDLATAILVRGEAGLSVVVTNPSAVAPWGRWETSQSQGGVSDEGTAILLGTNALERAGRERAQLTRGIRFEAARWLPFEHYRPGDVVLAPGDQGEMEPLRLRQITLTVSGEGELSGNLVLNDRFLEWEIRLARQAAGILAGGVSSGGTGGEPAPELPGGRVAAPPQGLIVEPAAYVDEYGWARGQITATWSPVTADVNGVAIEPDRYELHARVNEVEEEWRLIATSDTTTATYSPLVINQTYGFKVRAICQGTPGEFSDAVVALIPDDVPPPPAPSAPTLSTRLGVIEAAWDGLAHTGAEMPSDFDLLRVYMAAAEDGPYEVVDHLRAAGHVLITGQPYNTPRWIRFTAVDRRGNESEPSASASISTVPLVDTDIIGQVISGANIQPGTLNAADAVIANTITGALIQAGAIDTGHLRANSVTADQIAAGSVTAAALTADAVNGKTITGSVVRSSATGRRFVLDSSTLDLRFYPANNSNYTRLYAEDGWYPGETTTFITSGQNQFGSARAELQVAAGLIRLGIRNPNNHTRIGGGLDVAEDYALFGYDDGSVNFQSYIYLNATGRFYIRGRVWDSGEVSPYDAFAAGSFSIGGASSPNWVIYRYGPPGSTTPMATNMGPVVTLRDGGSGGPTAWNNNYVPKAWAITASSTEGFQVNLANGTSFAVYFWAHRH